MNIEEKNKMIGVLYEVEDERTRQNQKWGVQNHSPIEWIPILSEEVGEASKEALEYHFKQMRNSDAPENWDAEKLLKYRTELIQVAAVAVSMVECLDRNHWHHLKTVCRGNCGMNYCDDNGCTERKRILVDTDLIAVS
jgi:hypothetical protein